MFFLFVSVCLSKVVYLIIELCRINMEAVGEKLLHLLCSFCCSFFVFAFWELNTRDREARPSEVLFESINFSRK